MISHANFRNMNGNQRVTNISTCILLLVHEVCSHECIKMLNCSIRHSQNEHLTHTLEYPSVSFTQTNTHTNTNTRTHTYTHSFDKVT